MAVFHLDSALRNLATSIFRLFSIQVEYAGAMTGIPPEPPHRMVCSRCMPLSAAAVPPLSRFCRIFRRDESCEHRHRVALPPSSLLLQNPTDGMLTSLRQNHDPPPAPRH